MKKKSQNSKLRARLNKLPKKWLVLAIALTVILLACSTYVIVRSKNNKSSNTPTPMVKKGKATLSINSDPAGIQMTAIDPSCDGTQLNKPTPYTCSKTNQNLSTVITAPATAIISGKTYMFSTWDGCSESNANRAICKVNVDNGKVGKLMATYELYTPNLSTQRPTSQNLDQFVRTNSPPAISCSPINYGDYPNGGCGLVLTAKTGVLIKASYAPDCDSYHAGIEIRCRNSVTYYNGSISPALEFWCNADPKTPCGFADPYGLNFFESGYHIIRFTSPGTFVYGSESGQASLATLTGIYDKQTNTINISATYVAPVKDESYPNCCQP